MRSCTRTTFPTTTLNRHRAVETAGRWLTRVGAWSLPEVGVIFGGPSPEHDVSILTGLQAARELASTADVSVRGLFWSKSGDWYAVDPDLEGPDFLDGPPKGAIQLQFVLGRGGGFTSADRRMGRARALGLDVVLVCCHGGPGEDGSLQAALDLAGIRYAGPSVAGAALGMDKLAFGAVVESAGLPTLPRRLLVAGMSEVGFPGPYIVKPRFGGSSIGIEVVEDLGTALTLLDSSVHLSNGAIVEPYRPDLFDLQIAARSWPDFQLSAIERPLRKSGASSGREPEILGYRDKYSGGEGMVSAPRELPAHLPSELEHQIRDAAVRLAPLSGLRGVARIDFLSEGSEFWVNELNTIPGSLARYLWIDPPVAFKELLTDLLAEAESRSSRPLLSTGADGSILQSASSIAAKLS
jgi:D-alanine-D-alanine ligase